MVRWVWWIKWFLEGMTLKKINKLQRAGISLLIATGASYVFTGLVVGFLMQMHPLSLNIVNLMKLVSFFVIGFAVWHLLDVKDKN